MGKAAAAQHGCIRPAEAYIGTAAVRPFHVGQQSHHGGSGKSDDHVGLGPPDQVEPADALGDPTARAQWTEERHHQALRTSAVANRPTGIQYPYLPNHPKPALAETNT